MSNKCIINIGNVDNVIKSTLKEEKGVRNPFLRVSKCVIIILSGFESCLNYKNAYIYIKIKSYSFVFLRAY